MHLAEGQFLLKMWALNICKSIDILSRNSKQFPKQRTEFGTKVNLNM
jgi:hypothetical protein